MFETIRINFSTMNVIRKLHNVKHSQSSCKIILPFVGGIKDTDTNLVYEILQYGLHLFSDQKKTSEKIFVEGDKKDHGHCYAS